MLTPVADLAETTIRTTTKNNANNHISDSKKWNAEDSTGNEKGKERDHGDGERSPKKQAKGDNYCNFCKANTYTNPRCYGSIADSLKTFLVKLEALEKNVSSGKIGAVQARDSHPLPLRARLF